MANHFAQILPKPGTNNIVLFVVVAIAFMYGVGIGFFSLREPDTCFLLAVGRWICAHHTLPSSDPFSYTFSMFPQEHGLVLYQWLTEVIFYLIAKISGTIGLIIFSCTMLTYSLIIMPLRILSCFKLDILRAGLITILTALGSIERMMLKPEIFSYLFLALYIQAMVKHDMQAAPGKINWKLLLFLAGAMTLWANLHSGFVIGLSLLFLLASRDLLSFAYYKLFKTSHSYSFDSFWLIGFFVCSIGSLITPYGILLWKYIPHLYFHPINRYIGELKPLTIYTLMHNLPLLIALGGFLFLALLRVLNSFRTKLTSRSLFYLVVAIIGIVLGFLCQRLVTFALLLMLPFVGSGFRVKTDNTAADRHKFLYFVIVLSVMAGGIITALVIRPTIPASSRAFEPPFEALKYIDKKNLQGNLFNDPEFGDVLMWNSRISPKLFLDSRFDIYPWQILQDYMSIVDCKPGWQKLFANYKIDWIFLRPSTELCHKLEKDSQWKVFFKNEKSEIIVRREIDQGAKIQDSHQDIW